ncbi:MAG TPA: hypothetical protein VLT81_01450 [Chondromyces sp.]|nr:hypothetical protein [Chondromyces sp.]
MKEDPRRLCRVFVAVSLALSAVAAAGEEPAGFRVEDADLDLGRAVAGSTVTATFEFVNDTDRDVRILRAAPS